MLADDRLITLRGRRRIESFSLCDRCVDAQRQFAEPGLDPVVHGKVDGPRRKVTEDGRSKSAVQTPKAIVQYDVADGPCAMRSPSKIIGQVFRKVQAA